MEVLDDPNDNNLVEQQQQQLEEEEAPSKFRDPERLSEVLSREDPDRMKITAQEYEWAVAIKEIAEGLPDLDDLPDLMYVQLAILCRGNVEEAIERCYGMQEFRHEYNILDSYAEGCRYIRFDFEHMPRHLLMFDFCDKEGTYVFSFDLEKFDPGALANSQLFEDWMRHMYYVHHLYTPDIESIRKGLICMVECEGMALRRDVLKHFGAVFAQLLAHYPIRIRNQHYHTTAMVNVITSMLRKLVPKDIKENFQFGCKFDVHLGDAFLTPTVEAANQRMIQSMENALRLRYQNEMEFSLDDYCNT